MLSDSAISRLRDDLLAADFTIEGVTDRIGPAGVAALARNSTVAPLDALGDADDAQATLVRLWLLQQPVPVTLAEQALGDIEQLARSGLLTHSESGVTASIEIRPYGADDFSGWVCSDLTPLDGRITVPRPDFVLGASPASTTLAQLTSRRPVSSALDLGTGCGVQSLHLARHSDRVVATDLNPRALAMAALTLGLNHVSAHLAEGSLYDPVGQERFDLIITNPPYVMSPPTGTRLVYREGGFVADDLVRRVVVDGSDRLSEGGLLQVLGNWAITSTETWDERLANWIAPTGCDALVLQREVLDPYEYIEIWLADAGLAGSAGYLPAYRAWKRYFDELGIVGVGLGWLALARNGRDQPRIRIEEWPHAVRQPVGEAFAGFFDALAPSRLDDRDMLDRTWVLDGAVGQEALGRPGAPDPEHIVLRQQTGFQRAVEVDTGLAAILGACDGDLSLGALVGAVAGLLEVDAAGLSAELLPRLRTLVEEGFLRPARHS